MKKLLLIIIMVIVSVGAFAQKTYVREGNVFTTTKFSTSRTKSEPTKTKFIHKDTKGNEYPIFMSSTGSCFVVKTSAKTGKEYRNYLGPEMSMEICKELGIEYKGKKPTNKDDKK